MIKPRSLIACVLMIALSACNQKQAVAPLPAGLPEVSIVTVRAQPVPYVRSLPGRVAPLRVAEVRSRVSGSCPSMRWKFGVELERPSVRRPEVELL